MRNDRQAQHGLTLIELMVAISVLGLVAVLGWRGLDTIVRTRIMLTGDLEQTRGMQLAFAQMQSDCFHLANTIELPNRTPLATGPGWLALVRTVRADNQPSRLQVVSYRLREGKLERRESAATRDLAELDRQWLAATNDIESSPPVVLQDQVAALNTRMWIGNNWKETALPDVFGPPGQPAGLPGAGITTPSGLEVKLQLREHSIVKIFLLGAV